MQNMSGLSKLLVSLGIVAAGSAGSIINLACEDIEKIPLHRDLPSEEEHYQGMDVKYWSKGFRIIVKEGREKEKDKKWAISGTFGYSPNDNEVLRHGFPEQRICAFFYEDGFGFVDTGCDGSVEELAFGEKIPHSIYVAHIDLPISVKNMHPLVQKKLNERWQGLKKDLDFERIVNQWRNRWR